MEDDKIEIECEFFDDYILEMYIEYMRDYLEKIYKIKWETSEAVRYGIYEN